MSERTLNNLVQPIVLANYQVVERKVLAEGEKFRAFVMVRYPVQTAPVSGEPVPQKTEAADIKAKADAAQIDLQHAADAAAAGLDVRQNDDGPADGEPPAVPRPHVTATRM